MSGLLGAGLALTPYILAGGLILSAATGLQGYRMGAASNEARHLQEMSAAADRAAVFERERLASERQANLLALALEDQAYAEPSGGGACLPAARVLRLNKR